MKRLTMMMICIVLLIASTAWQAHAVELSLNSATVAEGGSAVLELNLVVDATEAAEAYAGVNATLTLPEGVTLAAILEGELLTGKNFRLDYASDTNAVIAYSATDTVDSDGNLLKIQVQVDEDAQIGNYDIPIASSGVSNADGSLSVAHNTIEGALTIVESITIQKAGTGNGTLTIGELICDESCQEIVVPYVEGAQYSVSVEPDQYSQFLGWQDASGAPIENLFYAQPGDTVYAVFALFGDVNSDGLVDIVDALMVAQYYTGLLDDDDIDTGVADVNSDGVIDIVDALVIAQYSVGLHAKLPLE